MTIVALDNLYTYTILSVRNALRSQLAHSWVTTQKQPIGPPI